MCPCIVHIQCSVYHVCVPLCIDMTARAAWTIALSFTRYIHRPPWRHPRAPMANLKQPQNLLKIKQMIHLIQKLLSLSDEKVVCLFQFSLVQHSDPCQLLSKVSKHDNLHICNQIKHHPYLPLMQDTVDQMIWRGDNCLNKRIHLPILIHLLDKGIKMKKGQP